MGSMCPEKIPFERIIFGFFPPISVSPNENNYFKVIIVIVLLRMMDKKIRK